MDVVDGYDSRATMNRQAVYASALVAGAGAASLVRLGAFGADRAWLTGIPIGTAFLAGVACVYSNEAKAQIYGAAANYLQRMVNNNERRLAWLRRRSTPGAKSGGAKGELDKSIKDAADASNSVGKYVEEYKHRQADEALKSTKAKEEEIKDVADRAAAACLRDDVLDVMERVERLFNILMPSGVTDRLKGVGNSIGETSGDWVTEEPMDQANKDLAYLNSPIASKCGVL